MRELNVQWSYSWAENYKSMYALLIRLSLIFENLFIWFGNENRMAQWLSEHLAKSRGVIRTCVKWMRNRMCLEFDSHCSWPHEFRVILSIIYVCSCVCWLLLWRRTGKGFKRIIRWAIDKNRFFSSSEHFLLKIWYLNFLKK